MNKNIANITAIVNLVANIMIANYAGVIIDNKLAFGYYYEHMEPNIFTSLPMTIVVILNIVLAISLTYAKNNSRYAGWIYVAMFCYKIADAIIVGYPLFITMNISIFVCGAIVSFFYILRDYI